MTTASQLATSSDVLIPAGEKAGLSLSFSQLKQQVQAVGTATNVLQITADGSTALHARALANAVANSLVEFEATTGSATQTSTLAGLEADAAQLTKQIENLGAQITSATSALNSVSASSATGAQDSALVASLTTQQNQATLELDNVNSEIAEAKVGALLAGEGTEVIQHASNAVPPSLAHKIYIGAIGTLAGLLVGVMVVMARYRRRGHISRRDQIADAVGMPVLMSISAATRRKGISDWAALLEHYSPSAAEHWKVQQLFREIHPETNANRVGVVSLAGDSAALVGIMQIAATLASLGVTTAIELAGRGEMVQSLTTACARLTERNGQVRPNLHFSKIGYETSHAPALTLTCIVTEGERPTISSPDRRRGPSILVVSAGSSTTEDLARVAIAADEAGLPLKGIVVTNPDPSDPTTGRVPQVIPRTNPVPHLRPIVTRS
jgi:capsular polysaccharide biosynthesis protein